MKKDIVIDRVYNILKSVTPIETDCGRLCDCECCKGDNQTGMLLFPGEESRYNNNSNFKIIRSEDNKNIVVCSGKCDRNLRPISCRIFPLIPVVDNNKIYVFDDPRAKGICPLLYDQMALDRKFEKSVYKAGKMLLKNKETKAFLLQLTEEITQVLSLQQIFM
ncbi:MAG: hypothetical protein E7536_02390 [Ruminococcaceae bacterium]|nr:hypothetical protein [Oscillospiraceae bacterium]